MVLQAVRCGGGEGRCSLHELCTGQFSLPPAGPDNTLYGAPCIRTERLLNVQYGLLQGNNYYYTNSVLLKGGHFLSHIV